METCLECGREGFRVLGIHLRYAHKGLKTIDYVKKWKHNGINPICKCGCGLYTAYSERRNDFCEFIRGHNMSGTTLSEITKERMKQTMVERHGVEYASQLPEVKENNRKKWKEKEQQILGKIKKTNLERYGVENTYQIKSFVEEFRKKRLLSYQAILDICSKKNYKPLFSEEEYNGYGKPYSFLCLNHNLEFTSTVQNVQRDGIFQCASCHIIGTSKAEIEIADFVDSILVNEKCERGSRYIISPYQLDIFTPTKNLAIEYHGLYYHSEKSILDGGGVFKPDSHRNKFLMCQEKGIKLLQIFEDEWLQKQDICKSILRSSLGLTIDKLNAGDLLVVEDFNKKAVIDFINTNHLQGVTKFSKSFCLVDSLNQIQFCITMRKPYTPKEKTIEIARVCTKIGTVVRGGFSRLFKRVIEFAKVNYDEIISYSDCRFSVGNVYKTNGFKFIKHTNTNYYYTDMKNRYFRFKYRARDGLTEKQVAEQNKVYRIYGAGNYLWQLDLKIDQPV